jgi:two-component system sensor histidine kinase KdpD
MNGAMPVSRHDVRVTVVALAAVAAVTLAYTWWLDVSNATTVALTFLLIVLVVAAASRLLIAVVTSVAAMLCFNYFFLPPVGTLTIADPHNWVALVVLLAVSLVASHLSAVARARTDEARARRDELARLFDLSRDVMMMTDSPEAMATLARTVARRFDLEFAAIALPEGDDDWAIFEAGAATVALDRRELASAHATARVSLEFDASSRTYAGHRTITSGSRVIRLVPLRVGTRPIGLLAAAGRPIELGTLDALAGVVAIAVERAQWLGERKAAELTRQSEELKTALLASLGHDLRTPLTAIRLAANNLKATWLSDEARAEQADLVLSEVERLTRLFQNVLEMARIDAGAVAAEPRWAHPSEIVAAARDQVAHTLREHTVRERIDNDAPVRLDPRLTATALAHLLENAAQYTPAGSLILVEAAQTDEGLVIRVRDHGPGIAPADLPRLFERFYRGAAARTRASGTGMGLWIARELLAAENGHVWAENTPGGGAQFTIKVPAPVRESSAHQPLPT